MATAIINSQMDAINESFSNISSDLTTIRPLLKNASIGAYPTDTASGSIASFTDGAEGIPVKSLSVDLEPVQDLNGQTSPYPAGGGVNKFAVNESATSSDVITSASASTGVIGIADTTAIKWATPYVGYTDIVSGKTYTISGGVLKYGRIGASTTTSQPSSANVPSTDIGAAIQSAINNAYASRTFTANATQRIYWFYCTDAGNSNHQAFNVQPVIVEGSSAGAWSPYENICPISGHDSVNVVRSGANMLTMDASKWGLYGTTESGWGNNVQRFAPYSQTIPFEAGKSYTIDVYNGMGVNKTFYVGVSEYNPSTTRIVDHGWQAVPYTFTVNANTTVIRMAFRDNSYSNCADYIAAIGTKLFVTMTEEAADTYPVSLGQTVYGGTLNVTTGVLTVDRQLVTYDGSEPWQNNGSAGVYINSSVNQRDANRQLIPINKYTTIAAGDATRLTNGQACWNRTITAIQIRDERAMTASLFKTLLASEPLQICYYLVTPTTVQLTPTEVTTLLGQNNIWSDAGEVSVVYRADTGLYIDKMIAQALNA